MPEQRNNDQQNDQNNIRNNQNSSLQDPGASVADYGKADQGVNPQATATKDESKAGDNDDSSVRMNEEVG